MKRSLKAAAALLLIAAMLAGCADIAVSPTESVTPESTVSEYITPEPTATATITPEPTVSATVTPEPTRIPVVEDYKLSGDSVILRSGQKASDMENYFGLTGSELIQQLGDGYEFVGPGPRDCCHYEKLGISLIFDVYDYSFEEAPLERIELEDDKLELNGLTPDMNFEQIQERIGKVKIKKTDNPEDPPEYDLIYKIGNIKLIFGSFTKDASDGYWVTIEYNYD